MFEGGELIKHNLKGSKVSSSLNTTSKAARYPSRYYEGGLGFIPVIRVGRVTRVIVGGVIRAVKDYSIKGYCFRGF